MGPLLVSGHLFAVVLAVRFREARLCWQSADYAYSFWSLAVFYRVCTAAGSACPRAPHLAYKPGIVSQGGRIRWADCTASERVRMRKRTRVLVPTRLHVW